MKCRVDHSEGWPCRWTPSLFNAARRGDSAKLGWRVIGSFGLRKRSNSPGHCRIERAAIGHHHGGRSPKISRSVRKVFTGPKTVDSPVRQNETTNHGRRRRADTNRPFSLCKQGLAVDAPSEGLWVAGVEAIKAPTEETSLRAGWRL